jgi:tRNA dimethylallyltransferase
MQPVIAIVGTNASGKSKLSVHLAHRLDGEIVSGDSRQVYRRLDLGTGKLSHTERDGIRHHLLDVAEPGTAYNVVQFQRDAYEAIDDISLRGMTPIVVGGTGLYMDAVTEGYQFVGVAPDPDRRRVLAESSLQQLLQLLSELDPTAVDMVEQGNQRRLIRAVEMAEAGFRYADTRRRSPRYHTLKLGVRWSPDTLRERIGTRLRARLDVGMVEEVQGLLDSGVSESWLHALGLEYRITLRYIRGEYRSFDDYVLDLERGIRRFARRQSAWFKRDPLVHWLDTERDYLAEAVVLSDRFISSAEPWTSR